MKMKKFVSLTLAGALALSVHSAAFAKEKEVSPFSILKEVEPGTYVAKDEGYSFQEVNDAIKAIQAKDKEKRKKQDDKDLKDVVIAQDGELLGQTHWWLNTSVDGKNFDSIALAASMDWTNTAVKSSWDYSVQGYTSPNFGKAKAEVYIHLVGLDISWPPIAKTYNYPTSWASKTYTVGTSGDDYDYGAWAWADAGASFTVQPASSTISKTFNY